MSFPLNDLSTGQLLALTNALAIGFSKGLKTDEIDILASLITAVGDLMALIAESQERQERQERQEGN